MCDRLQVDSATASRARKDNSRPCYTFEPGILKREGGHYYKNVYGTLRANAGDNQMAVAYTLKLRGGLTLTSKKTAVSARQERVL